MAADWLYLRDPKAVNLVSFWSGDPSKLLGPYPGAAEQGVVGFADLSPTRAKNTNDNNTTVAFAHPRRRAVEGYRVVHMNVTARRDSLRIELVETPDPLTSGCTIYQISESAIADPPAGRPWGPGRRGKIAYDRDAVYDWSEWSLNRLSRTSTGWTHEFSRYYPPPRAEDHYVFRRCPYEYRGVDCGYTGTARFTKDNAATNSAAEDECNKSISACELRFGRNPARFGGLDVLGNRPLDPVYTIPVFPEPEPDPDPRPPIPRPPVVPEPPRPTGPTGPTTSRVTRTSVITNPGTGTFTVPRSITTAVVGRGSPSVSVQVYGAGGGGGGQEPQAGSAGIGGGSAGSAGRIYAQATSEFVSGGGGGGGGGTFFGSIAAGGGGGGSGGSELVFSGNRPTACVRTFIRSAPGGDGGDAGNRDGGRGGMSRDVQLDSQCRVIPDAVHSSGRGGEGGIDGGDGLNNGVGGRRPSRSGVGSYGFGGNGEETNVGDDGSGGGAGAFTSGRLTVTAGQRISYSVGGGGGGGGQARAGGNGAISLSWVEEVTTR